MSTQLQKAIDEMEDARENTRKMQSECIKGTATSDDINAANDRLSVAVDSWRRAVAGVEEW